MLQSMRARDEQVKGVYRALGKASGMDVDAIEKQARADEKAEAAKAAAAPAPGPATSSAPVAKP